MKTKSVVLKEFEQILNAKYNGQTVPDYLFHTGKFLDFVKNAPLRVSNEDYFNYNIYLAGTELSYSYRNCAVNAINAFFNLYLRTKIKKYACIRPPKEIKLPKDIPLDILNRSIDLINNTKAKLILLLAYGCGLRSAETINLKLENIDVERNELLIKGKGNKERVIPFSENISRLMISYVDEYNPEEYLFNGQSKPKYTSSSILKLVKKYIGDYTYHQIRHTYATTLLRNGMPNSEVSRLLGHSQLETTMIYNHITTKEVKRELLPV